MKNLIEEFFDSTFGGFAFLWVFIALVVIGLILFVL